jgi:hypothetical protein
MTSHHAARPPVLDGDLTEWHDLSPLVINDKADWGGHHQSRWTGPDDLSGRVWSRWDDQHLYFAIEVTDDHHHAPVANRDMHKYDCVHLGFDLRRDALDPQAFFVEDDCDYGVTLTDRGVAYRFWGAKRPEETPKEMVVAARREGTLTTYEIAMPWKAEFEPYAGPRPGHVIGLTLMLRDLDPGEREGFLRWGEGLRWHTKRPALFNSLQLVR